jgi:hypothetical protein
VTAPPFREARRSGIRNAGRSGQTLRKLTSARLYLAFACALFFFAYCATYCYPELVSLSTTIEIEGHDGLLPSSFVDQDNPVDRFLWQGGSIAGPVGPGR